jgi:phenylacetate-CoA ligase
LGQSPCGRTNMRIKGWMGRADQTTKIKGMFVRPEQVASIVDRHAEVVKVRVIVQRLGQQDVMIVQLESTCSDESIYAETIEKTLKLKGVVEIVAPESLPKDGLVIEDQRSYD